MKIPASVQAAGIHYQISQVDVIEINGNRNVKDNDFQWIRTIETEAQQRG